MEWTPVLRWHAGSAASTVGLHEKREPVCRLSCPERLETCSAWRFSCLGPLDRISMRRQDDTHHPLASRGGGAYVERQRARKGLEDADNGNPSFVVYSGRVNNKTIEDGLVIGPTDAGGSSGRQYPWIASECGRWVVRRLPRLV